MSSSSWKEELKLEAEIRKIKNEKKNVLEKNKNLNDLNKEIKKEYINLIEKKKTLKDKKISAGCQGAENYSSYKILKYLPFLLKSVKNEQKGQKRRNKLSTDSASNIPVKKKATPTPMVSVRRLIVAVGCLMRLD